MTQMTLNDYRDRLWREPDPCRHRHGGNECSVAAYRRVDASGDRRAVLDLVRGASVGLTLKEACSRLGRSPNQISGRFTELKASGLIRVEGRRDGCGVYRANNRVDNE